MIRARRVPSRSGARRGAAVALGAALLTAAALLGAWTVRSMDGPWGSPGRPGTLIVERCTAGPPAGGTPPTMRCVGTFTPDRSGPAVPGVSLSGPVRPWSAGDIRRARLPEGSRRAYTGGSGDWMVPLGFAAVLLLAGVTATGTGLGLWRGRPDVR
ncbi:hypothetical protein SAMN04489712_112197 [Thermomonospora echinospora]|uniref:Uncharacterized protein n=1 Tax=Thermomonospora echinospora TaxID=1992 RepID=A0A1H6D1U5_9ACTN|nr:hypothetical protein [Thermomonospora echinospora]SEG79311.1 hypothetical protein SAMN04489712_112197 [Thermomonospora echinospora]